MSNDKIPKLEEKSLQAHEAQMKAYGNAVRAGSTNVNNLIPTEIVHEAADLGRIDREINKDAPDVNFFY